MRFITTAFALASVASAYTPILSNVSPNKSSANPLTPTEAPAKICKIETVTVYETTYSLKGGASTPTPSNAKGGIYGGKGSTVIATLSGAKPTPPSAKGTPSRYKTHPTAKVAKPFGQKEEYFNFQSEGDIKLQPCTHWDYNTNDPKNLVPSGKNQLYYAEGGRNNAKPTNEFYFGVIDLLFKAPAVVLEHSSYVRKARYSSNELVVDFSSAYACDFAKESWPRGTIIVSSTAGCKASSDDDQCYFRVEDIIKSDDGKSIVIKGYPQARDDCTEGGEAHWGRYKPKKGGASDGNQPGGTSSYRGFPTSSPSASGLTLSGTGTYNPSTPTPSKSSDLSLLTPSASDSSSRSDISITRTTAKSTASEIRSPSGTHTSSGVLFPSETLSLSGIHSLSQTHFQSGTGFQSHSPKPSATDFSDNSHSSMPTSSGTPNQDSVDDGDKAFGDEDPTCHAPADTKYNLPTACPGEFFDLDLDDFVGYGELSADDLAFLREATEGLDSEALSGLSRRAAMHRRHLERRIIKKLWSGIKRVVIEPTVSALKTTAKVGTAVIKGGVQLLTTGTISGGIKESFNFALPDGDKADVKQVDSPWGPAALIAAYGTESKLTADKGVQREGYLNIYCVGCGAQGRVELAGHATWAVGQGITKGELEAWADLKVAMKVGVDAQIKLTREWKKKLFQKGLPKLSFGPIIIGPQVRVESRVTLEAGAEGRILAGAEMNWNRAYAKVDFVDPTKSTRHNFDPVSHPTFEAEGSLYVGAELGLPIGMHFGITVASWSKTVGLINEPMIKGIAKAAIKAELADGKITAGFTLTEGCQGIHANLSWRNKLVCNVLDIREFTLLDSDYKNIKSMCIPLGKQTPPQVPGGEGEGEGTGEGNGEGNGEGTGEGTGEGSGEESGEGTGEGSGEGTGEGSGEGTGEGSGEGTGEGSGEGTGEGSGEGTGEGSGQETKRSLLPRQDTSDNTPSTTTEDLPAGIREITDSVKSAIESVNYALSEVKTVPYERTDGYEFTKLLAGDYNIVYCSNGNMYVKQVAQLAGLGCDELFAYSQDAVVGDGQGRYFYYHEDSMKAAGVSRLRLGDEEIPVKGTSAVAMAAWSASETETDYDADIEGLYVVADYATEDLYWLSFCTYTDGQPPRVFIVSDIDAGITVLESSDVKFSVTGGDVDKCYPLMAKEDPALRDNWAEWDDSLEVDADGLDFDLAE
ncbi:hypothetical protein BKA66DRAFT_189557 [Pyrenochaeta sp. MPI-SDFR-AT-0127]|nr:hypothetical protein BKA66DRAFT_189557 [Pyrenochaeta sp. MPI-SDFR-AT-0127]